MLISLKLLNIHFYIANYKMRKKCARRFDDDNGFKSWKKDVIKPLRKRSQMRCEICGKKDAHLVAHHLLPYSRFNKYRTDLDNLIFICNDCHSEIHQNPFINRDIIIKECERRNINYRDYYGTEISY